MNCVNYVLYNVPFSTCFLEDGHFLFIALSRQNNQPTETLSTLQASSTNPIAQSLQKVNSELARIISVVGYNNVPNTPAPVSGIVNHPCSCLGYSKSHQPMSHVKSPQQCFISLYCKLLRVLTIKQY